MQVYMNLDAVCTEHLITIIVKHKSMTTQCESYLCVLQAMKLPLYWKAPLFRACVRGDQQATPTVTLPLLRKTWQRYVEYVLDDVHVLFTSAKIIQLNEW